MKNPITVKQFISKYKGNYPDVQGRNLWKTWQDIEKDMEKDLNVLLSPSDDVKEKLKREIIDSISENESNTYHILRTFITTMKVLGIDSTHIVDILELLKDYYKENKTVKYHITEEILAIKVNEGW